MPEMIWINGEILPLADARVGVEDRGFQFADGVYEVIRLYNGRPFTLAEHLERLERSCGGIAMRPPMPRAELARHVTDFVGKSPVKEGMVYLQATRGCCPRNHVFTPGTKPTVLFYTRELPPIAPAGQGDGATLLSVPDERWKKCWIKSIALLANVLAKNAAVAAGADEGVFVEDGLVSECTASNFFAVAGGKLLTHPVGPKVLPGITRLVLLGLARELDIPVVERPVSEAEALAADEVFITSTTREISWVRRWNDKIIGQGRCGPVTLRLHRALQERIRHETA
jgi:D-alanine transaminase